MVVKTHVSLSKTQKIMFGMGCFWGAERFFGDLYGVHSTAVGFTGGHKTAPSYEDVCRGDTNHNEVVLVAYNEDVVALQELLKIFWESHDPTQGMRQGNDIGTQYRSGIYAFDKEQKQIAYKTKEIYQLALNKAGFSTITTEILDATKFYCADIYHQKYLAKNPTGYCGIGGTGVIYPK